MSERDYPGLFTGISGFKAGFGRAIEQTARAWPPGQRAIACRTCGNEVPVRQGPGEDLPVLLQNLSATDSYARCPACGRVSYESLSTRVFALPEVQQFWRAHPRMRLLAERRLEAAGVPAVVTGFESMTGSVRLEVVVARDAFVRSSGSTAGRPVGPPGRATRAHR
jgi:hypothetical protein